MNKAVLNSAHVEEADSAGVEFKAAPLLHFYYSRAIRRVGGLCPSIYPCLHFHLAPKLILHNKQSLFQNDGQVYHKTLTFSTPAGT